MKAHDERRAQFRRLKSPSVALFSSEEENSLAALCSVQPAHSTACHDASRFFFRDNVIDGGEYALFMSRQCSTLTDYDFYSAAAPFALFAGTLMMIASRKQRC